MHRPRKPVVLLILLLLVAATVFTPALGQRKWSPRRPDRLRAPTPYLETAVAIANWLSTIERPMNPGIGWGIHDQPGAPVVTGVSEGAAGIGFFFIRLYQVTKNPTYLDKARGAADYIAAAQASGRMSSAEWFTGRAGEGDFFLALYAATGEQLQLDRARAVGDWLLRDAKAAGGGYQWVHPPPATRVYTGFAHGTAGVVSFLTSLYEATRHAPYLDYAEGGVRWMKQYIYTWDETAIGWKRLTTDANAYHGWCGGATGIYFVLKRLYSATGDEEYRAVMLKTARGLAVTAERRCPVGGAPYAEHSCPAATDEHALSWVPHSPVGGMPMTAYCHGASTNSVALFDAYRETGDETFLRAARGGALWMKAMGEAAPGGLKWKHIYGESLEETGLGGGVAGAGYAFLKYARYHPDPSYIESAKSAAGYLIALAERPRPGQMRWPNYTSKPDWINDPAMRLSGWYVGAAGIGMFMLEMHGATVGARAPLADPSGINP